MLSHQNKLLNVFLQKKLLVGQEQVKESLSDLEKNLSIIDFLYTHILYHL